jgi:hypothetical protein
MNRASVAALGAIVAMVSWLSTPARGADGDVDAGTDGPRVYTNEDLEKLPPLQPLVIIDDDGQPLKIEGAEERWAFVDSVLGQAYARIDADRAYRIERRRSEAEADAVERLESRPRYLLPYSYFYRGEVGAPREESRLRRAASRLWDPPNARLFRPITPIHARPYLTNVLRAKSRLSATKPASRLGRGAGSRRPPN